MGMGMTKHGGATLVSLSRCVRPGEEAEQKGGTGK
jgi:hypothetical protein